MSVHRTNRQISYEPSQHLCFWYGISSAALPYEKKFAKCIARRPRFPASFWPAPIRILDCGDGSRLLILLKVWIVSLHSHLVPAIVLLAF